MENQNQNNPLPFFSYAGTFASSQSTSIHSHHGAELVYVVNGHCVNVCNESSIDGEAGDCIIIPQETPHYQKNYCDVKTFYAVFEPGGTDFDCRNRKICVGDDHFIVQWMNNLVTLNESLDNDQGSGIIYAVLHRLAAIEANQAGQHLLHPVLAAAINWLEENFAQDAAIEELAVKFGVSPPYFNALFNQEFSFGPAKYRRNIRMKISRQLLMNPYLTIAEIGDMCGYPDPNYFSRIFRCTHGCSPSKWRKMDRRWIDKTVKSKHL